MPNATESLGIRNHHYCGSNSKFEMSIRFFTNHCEQTLPKNFRGFSTTISTLSGSMRWFPRRPPRPVLKTFTAARDETAALTAQIQKIEH